MGCGDEKNAGCLTGEGSGDEVACFLTTGGNGFGVFLTVSGFLYTFFGDGACVMMRFFSTVLGLGGSTGCGG